MNLSLTIAYDGTLFFGWQKNSIFRTVEGELEKVLFQILQHPVELQAASRTDRGVHAYGQIVQFHTHKNVSLHALHKSLHALLPPDITILKLHEVASSFHPSLDAVSKTYLYRIHHHPSPFLRNYSWYIPTPLDIPKMQAYAIQLIGKHDFKAFCNMRRGLCYQDTLRELYALSIQGDATHTLITIEGHHFLYNMVRIIVGTLVNISQGKLSGERLLEKKRSSLGVTAPSYGLYLDKIAY